MTYDDIVEVFEAYNAPKATAFLNAGYRLLAIDAVRWTTENNYGAFQHKAFHYVVGRTAAVPRFEGPGYVVAEEALA